ncbi:MAG: hypothetical protein IPM12_04310 [Flavobacteriales bacterium]|nr:hypothetical protein [Flavobacteriales bacterium]
MAEYQWQIPPMLAMKLANSSEIASFQFQTALTQPIPTMKSLLALVFALFIGHLKGATLYWINGAGNWNDPTHWSNSSGGASCACVPTTTDDVIFDSNSFTGAGQSVTVNAQAYCRNMTWTAGLPNPTLAGNQPLDIYGSYTLTQSMNLTHTGLVTFKSNSGNSTITTAGKIVRSSITFNGIGGAWTLQDSLVTYNTGTTITLTSGALNTNSQYVFANQLYSAGSGVRALSLGSSTLVLTSTSSTYDAWQLSASNMSFSAGSSLIRLTGSGNPSFSGGGLQYHNLEFTNASGTGFINSANNSFNDVSFAGNGDLNGNQSYHDLTFATSKTYTLSGESDAHRDAYGQWNLCCADASERRGLHQERRQCHHQLCLPH